MSHPKTEVKRIKIIIKTYLLATHLSVLYYITLNFRCTVNDWIDIHGKIIKLFIIYFNFAGLYIEWIFTYEFANFHV